MKSIVTLITLACFLPTGAWATTCASGPYASAPGDGASAVPINAQIVIWSTYSQFDASSVQIVATSGEVIETDFEAIQDNGQAFKLSPLSVLEANSEYVIEVSDGNDDWVFSTFETGADEDTTAPDMPTMAALTKGEDTNWFQPFSWITVEVDPADEAVYYRVESSADDTFDRSEFATVLAGNEGVVVTTGPCGDTLAMDADDVGNVRLVAIDLAGNESAPTESKSAPTESKSAPTESSRVSGCSSVGLAGLGWFGLSVIPLLARRRKR